MMPRCERLRALGSAAVLVAVVFGIPLVVVLTGSLDPPEHWPSGRVIWLTIRDGRVSHDVAIGAAAIVVLITWFRFVLDVLVALRSVMAGRSVPRSRGLVQMCAIALVSSAVVLVSHSVPTDAASGRVDPHSAERSRPTMPAPDTSCAPLDLAGGPDLTLGLGGAVLVAGGVVVHMERVRRRDRRASAGAVPSTRSVAMTDPGVLERRLRRQDPVERLVRLDLALRLAASLTTTGDPNREHRVATAIVHPDGSVDIGFLTPVPTTAPFVVGRRDDWHLPGDTAIESLSDIASGGEAPSPSLVHLGTADGGDLFVDLDAIGLLTIEGRNSELIARAITVALVTSPFARGLSLIGVGVDLSGIDDIVLTEGVSVTYADTLDEAIDIAAVGRGQTVLLLRGGTAVGSGRLPTGDPSPAIVCVGGPSPDGWALVSSSGWWILHPLGLVVKPVVLGDNDIGELRRVLSPATSSPGPLEARRIGPHDNIRSAPSPASPFVEVPWTFVVRVLGPVVIECRDGTPVTFEKSKSAELITWLALHRERPSRLGARTAMWDLDVQDTTFANTVSEARRALVRAMPNGEEWLGRTFGDTLPLHPSIVTDADLLEARLQHARRQSLVEAVETLRAGLAWVRGMPCAEAGFRWPDVDGTTSRLVMLVTGAAVEMATLCLTVDDLEGVFWSTGRGLMALPGHEELVGLRMRGHARRGDLAGVRHEWSIYVRSLRCDGWGEDPPSPKLIALHDQLLSPSDPALPPGDHAPTTAGVM